MCPQQDRFCAADLDQPFSEAAIIAGSVWRFSCFLADELQSSLGSKIARLPWATGGLKLFVNRKYCEDGARDTQVLDSPGPQASRIYRTPRQNRKVIRDVYRSLSRCRRIEVIFSEVVCKTTSQDIWYRWQSFTSELPAAAW